MTNTNHLNTLTDDAPISLESPVILDDQEISWCFYRADGTKVGGAYTTHAGAAQTARQFPAYFAGAHIVPCVNRAPIAGAVWNVAYRH